MDRESLHKLPKRYELRKTDNLKNIKLLKVHNGLDGSKKKNFDEIGLLTSMPSTAEDLGLNKGGVLKVENLRFMGQLRLQNLLSTDTALKNTGKGDSKDDDDNEKEEPVKLTTTIPDRVPSFYDDDLNKYKEKKIYESSAIKESKTSKSSHGYKRLVGHDEFKGDLSNIVHLMKPRIAGPGGQDTKCHPVTVA